MGLDFDSNGLVDEQDFKDFLSSTSRDLNVLAYLLQHLNTACPDNTTSNGDPPSEQATPTPNPDATPSPNPSAVPTPTEDPLPPHVVSNWVHDGFDLAVDGDVTLVGQWTPYTKERYVVVTSGGSAAISVSRNANLRNANGDLDTAGATYVHEGGLTIGPSQFWTPDSYNYVPAGEYAYTAPITIQNVTAPTCVQIWNRHPGILFNGSTWLAYGSNALELWIVPDTAALPAGLSA